MNATSEAGTASSAPARLSRSGLARFDRMPPDVPDGATDGPMINGFRFAPGGPPEPLAWPVDVEGEGWAWVHLDRTHTGTEPWLREGLGLGDQVVEGLLDEGTRPRLTRTADGMLLILRGINFNEGAAPEDMVALRLWITPRLVVSLRRSPILAVHELRSLYAAGEAPAGPGTFLADLIERLTDSANEVVDDLMGELDVLEERVVEGAADREADETTAPRISGVRRRLVRLRRYLAPQRDALTAFLRAAQDLLDETARLDLSESIEQTQRYVEEVEAARERAVILSDELASRADERVSRHSYMLSVAAGVFLPITFLTGLLGINVGGMPGADDPDAFWVVVAVCSGMAIATLAFFLGRRWL